MVDEFEDACETAILRRAGERSLARSPQGERSRVAWLVARLYAGGSALQRSTLLDSLMRPLGPLALVGVASGAFACFVGRAAATTLEDVGRFSRAQVFELAQFVEQVQPQALRAIAQAVADNRAGLSAFAEAAARLLARLVGLGEPAAAEWRLAS